MCASRNQDVLGKHGRGVKFVRDVQISEIVQDVETSNQVYAGPNAPPSASSSAQVSNRAGYDRALSVKLLINLEQEELEINFDLAPKQRVR